jgi:hypothetical protein
MIKLTLLQTDIDFFAETDQTSTIIFGIVFLALIAVAVIGNAISQKRGGRSSGSSSGGGFKRGRFRRTARRTGLDRNQISALEDIAVSQKLRNPERLLVNGKYLDDALARAIFSIDESTATEEQRESQKTLLFQAKRTIASHSTSKKPLPSTRAVKQGTDVRITRGRNSYDTVVAGSTQRFIGVRAPKSANGEPMRFRRGEPVNLAIMTSADRVFAFDTRVHDQKKISGMHTVLFPHKENVEQIQKRRYPRREFDRACYFYRVRVVTTGTGRNQQRQAVINKDQRHLGRIEDISAGGCAVRASNPLGEGRLIRVDFDTHSGEHVTAFGKVKSIDQSGRGGLMHIAFTRMSRKNLNKIAAYAYGYAEHS